MTAGPTARWRRRPEGSNWGDFGPDDQLGRLNLITPETVKAAAREIIEGLSFCLSLPLDYPGGNALNSKRFPPSFKPTSAEGVDTYNYRVAAVSPGHTDVVSDDVVLLYTQYSTQWDSFAHVGGTFDADGDGVAESVYYNGYRAGAHIFGPNGEVPGAPARAISISKMYFCVVVKPGPPNSLGQPVQSQPFRASRFCQSISRSFGKYAFRATFSSPTISGVRFSFSQSRTSCWKASSSLPNVKSIGGSS